MTKKYSIDIKGFAKVRPSFKKGTGGRRGYTFMPPEYRKRQWNYIDNVFPKPEALKLLGSSDNKTSCPQVYYKEAIPVFDSKLKLTVTFYFNKTYSGDIDNLIGGVLDAFNRIIWEDDKLIRKISSEVREHAGFNRVEFTVTETD